jgi:hypothetical protein
VKNQRRTEIRVVFYPPGDLAGMHRQAKITETDIERGVEVHNRFYGLPLVARALALPLLTAGELEADPIYWHLRHVICAGDADAAHYLCRWLAYILQLRTKTEICVVLTGGHGTGKTLFVKKIKEMLDPYYYPMQNIGNINVCGEEFEHALLVFCDEVSKVNETLYNRYKTAITDDEQQTRNPHHASAVFSSFSNFIFSTNEPNLEELLPMEQGERRFVVLRVSGQLIGAANNEQQRTAYFTRLRDASVGPLMRYLLQHSVIRRGEGYLSDATFDAKVGSLDQFEQWWYSCLKQGHISFAKQALRSDVFNWMDLLRLQDRSRATKVEVYTCYLEYTSGPKLTNLMYWKRMHDFDAGDGNKRRNNIRCIAFNSLDQCRSAFCLKMGAQLPWFNSAADQAVASAARDTLAECNAQPAAMSTEDGAVNIVDTLPTEEEMLAVMTREAHAAPLSAAAAPAVTFAPSASSAGFDYTSGSSDIDMSDDDAPAAAGNQMRGTFEMAGFNAYIMATDAEHPPFSISAREREEAARMEITELREWADQRISSFLLAQGWPATRARLIASSIAGGAFNKELFVTVDERGQGKAYLASIFSSSEAFWGEVHSCREWIDEKEEEAKRYATVEEESEEEKMD